MKLIVPHSGIVLLIGPSNSGKSTLLQQWIDEKSIKASEVVSSDEFRILVSDTEFIDWRDRPKNEADSLFDEYNNISREAFAMMDSLIEARCRLNKLTFIDATNLQPDDRQRYITLAKKHHVPILAVILDIPEKVLFERDEKRNNPRGKRRIKQQYQVFNKQKRFIKKEGYTAVYTIKETDEAELIRRSNPLFIDVGAGIDVIGDIHGCYEEMLELLHNLGYEQNSEGLYIHPEGRKFLSIGDVMSRGPESLKTMLFFVRHAEQGLSLMIDSNHGWKIARWLEGRKVSLGHGDEKVAQEIEDYEAQYGPERANELKGMLKDFLLKAPSHYVVTKNGVPMLVCAHAGIKDEFIGKQSREVSDFCRYGDTAGFNEDGKPIRKDWFVHHKSSVTIIWGHDPKPQPLIVNNTINIDQGAVFGGRLTAYRYPEEKFFFVKAKRDYSGMPDNPLLEWERNRFNPPNIGKFINGYSVITEELDEVRVYEDIVKPAIDTVSHYTVPIEQLIYIPPTMSPTPVPSSLENYLEHPEEAIGYYRNHGITRLVAEKKHMGSRGILFLFKDEESALKYTGMKTLGTIYTRTGRRFFDRETEAEIVRNLNNDLCATGYFTKYETDFVLLDAEIMPWNLKAKELIQNQYAHVAEAALLDRKTLAEKLAAATVSNTAVEPWLEEYRLKLANATAFKEVFQHYCWDVDTIKKIRIAPFHVLAHSTQAFFDRPHTWHMEMNRVFAELSDLFVETEFKIIDDEASEAEAIQWWTEMTEAGNEGIVIKPESFVPKADGKLIQPAIKVRGRKYLGIIYGMDYLLPANLERLKKRTTGKKQKLALKEFALGLEGIKRFVAGESIERVHECVLATLAMESDPVDPRL
ncbi:polynucleotide kinase-phosphatase [Bacillus sp. FJAT-27445]|uniref:polynucleotide kinase-phosphatase n=1 Tax=Bacillus sp. FJAT-27445 TaxID=1679166 RepID=UPI0007431A34|nr:polynucleotide kinase-phosphatase [Bacillus sp. FJAT-27445]